MATLPETGPWVNGIYQLETTDPVEAGPLGISNRQAKELAIRTRYLYDLFNSVMAPVVSGKVYLLFNDVAANIPPGYNPVISMQGRIPVGLAPSGTFGTLGAQGGSTTETLTVDPPISGWGISSGPPTTGDGGKILVGSGLNEIGESFESIRTATSSPNQTINLNKMNPYTVVNFIQWVGLGNGING